MITAEERDYIYSLPYDELPEGWSLEWDDVFSEYIAAHEDYDGAPDGNNGLMVKCSDRAECISQAWEIDYAYQQQLDARTDK